MGKTQIQRIIKDQEAIIKRWESAENGKRKLAKVRHTSTMVIDEKVWDRFCTARARNIPVTGKLIQKKALCVPIECECDDFMALNGWLRRWLVRHNVHVAVLSGEWAEVSKSDVDDWIKRSPSICEGYKA